MEGENFEKGVNDQEIIDVVPEEKEERMGTVIDPTNDLVLTEDEAKAIMKNRQEDPNWYRESK